MFVEYINYKRCQCKNKNNKVCMLKQYKLFIYNNKRVCTLHFKILFEKYIIIIQKIYRSYKSRKKLKYFYIRLPDDIQYKIKYFINEEFYIKKFNNNLKKVVNNKIKNFVNKYFNLLDDKSINYPINNIDKYLLEKYFIIENYRIFYKYNSLISIHIKDLVKLLANIIFVYHSDLKKYYYINNININTILYDLTEIDGAIRFYIYHKMNFW
jgi:hypothetical protein